MYERIKNISNSKTFLFGILVMLVSMIITSLTFREFHTWTPLAVIATVVGTITMAMCIGWGVYACITKKDVMEMNPWGRSVMISIGGLLTLIWLYINTNLFITAVWIPFWVWEVSKSVREARGEG